MRYENMMVGFRKQIARPRVLIMVTLGVIAMVLLIQRFG